MRIKIKKVDKHKWRIAILRNEGGFSSLVVSREGPFLYAIKALSFNNISRALKLEDWAWKNIMFAFPFMLIWTLLKIALGLAMFIWLLMWIIKL